MLVRLDLRLRGIAASTDAVGGGRWDEGFAVIAEAADGEEAVAAVERSRPQIVLLDVQLPGVEGFAVAERLAAGRDPPVVVLISSREAAAYGPRLQAAPAHGFIPKRELSGSALAALVG